MKELFQSRHCGNRKRVKNEENDSRQTMFGAISSMVGYGDRTGSANTQRNRFLVNVQGKLTELSFYMLMSHESANEEECDTRDSTNRSKCNQTTKLGESRRFDFGAWNQVRMIAWRDSKNPEIQRIRLKDKFYSIAIVEDALLVRCTAKRKWISRDRGRQLRRETRW